MNARFRKGRKYQFNVLQRETEDGLVFISDRTLIYKGFDKRFRVYQFVFSEWSSLTQGCSKSWLDNNLVTYEEVK